MTPAEDALFGEASDHARIKNWASCMSTSSRLLGSADAHVAGVARLNVMIGHYHQGAYTNLIPRDLAGLIDQLPSEARPTCVGLIALAAHRLGDQKLSQVMLLILAGWELEPLDVPSIPDFVRLRPAPEGCHIQEAADSSPMMAALESVASNPALTGEELQKIQSLKRVYDARALAMGTQQKPH